MFAPDKTATAGIGDLVRTTARAFERDRYLAALLAPRDVRDDLIALAAFAGELARIPGLVSDPLIAEIRLQWWRDTIEAGLGSGTDGSGHPIADAISSAARRRGLFPADLHPLIDAQSARLDDSPFTDLPALEANLAAWDGGLFRLTARIFQRRAPLDAASSRLLEAAGSVYGLARLLAEWPVDRSQGRRLLPRAAISGHTKCANATPGLLPDETAIETTVGVLTSHVLERMMRIAAPYQEAPRAVRMAALPLALVRPYLRLSQRVGSATSAIHDIGPLTRVWRLWMASLTGRL